MSVFLNLGSILLGLISWALPLASITLRKKSGTASFLSTASFACCSFSLLFQLFEVRNRVNLEDWSALMDTINAVILAAVVLICITAVLNIFSLKYARNNH